MLIFRFLLVSSAFSMGGVAIWCMHYIGNRAIVLYGGQNRLQLSYSAGFTVLSFFIPVIVLLLAYIIIGAVENPAIWRLLVGGTFAGAAICGMHYLVCTSPSGFWLITGTTVHCQLHEYIQYRQRYRICCYRYCCHNYRTDTFLQTSTEMG